MELVALRADDRKEKTMLDNISLILSIIALLVAISGAVIVVYNDPYAGLRPRDEPWWQKWKRFFLNHD